MRLEMIAAIPLFVPLATGAVRAQSVEEQYRIPGDPPTDTLFLRRFRPAAGAPVREGRVVLLVHGATFPSATAAAFRFDGHSWMDDLSAAGFDVWALDFPGYGLSDRYREMQEPPLADAPVGRAVQASRHLGRAVSFIAREAGVRKVSIVAHSWGTLVAGHYASEFPEQVDRLVLFGPVAMRSGPVAEPKRAPAYTYVTKEDQWAKFTDELPEGEQPKFRHRTSSAGGERISRAIRRAERARRTACRFRTARWSMSARHGPAGFRTIRRKSPRLH